MRVTYSLRIYDDIFLVFDSQNVPVFVMNCVLITYISSWKHISAYVGHVARCMRLDDLLSVDFENA